MTSSVCRGVVGCNASSKQFVGARYRPAHRANHFLMCRGVVGRGAGAKPFTCSAKEQVCAVKEAPGSSPCHGLCHPRPAHRWQQVRHEWTPPAGCFTDVWEQCIGPSCMMQPKLNATCLRSVPCADSMRALRCAEHAASLQDWHHSSCLTHVAEQTAYACSNSVTACRGCTRRMPHPWYSISPTACSASMCHAAGFAPSRGQSPALRPAMWPLGTLIDPSVLPPRWMLRVRRSLCGHSQSAPRQVLVGSTGTEAFCA